MSEKLLIAKAQGRVAALLKDLQIIGREEAVARLDAELSDAEERGRRAGIEEAAKALWEHRRHGGIYVGGTPEEIVRALAPPDSGKEMGAAEEAIAARRKARQDEEAEAFKYADEDRK